METNEELIRRYAHVKDLVAKAGRKAARMKPGSNKTRAYLWAGSLGFTLLSVEREMRERGLSNE